MFKEGNWVSSEFFKGVRQIVEINDKEIVVEGLEDKFFYDYELNLVCGFVKGQEIEVRYSFSQWKKFKFYSYDVNLLHPFLSIDKLGNVNNWKEARAIEPKYKAYTKPKLDWINEQKTIKAKGIDGFHTIYGCEKLYNDWAILIRDNETNDEDIISLLQMYNYWEWADNSPCGEKEKNNEEEI